MYFRMPRVFSPLQAELGLQSSWKCCILQIKKNKRYKLNNNFFLFFLIFNFESVAEFLCRKGESMMKPLYALL